jgi:hypothetical protein
VDLGSNQKKDIQNGKKKKHKKHAIKIQKSKERYPKRAKMK